MLSEPSGFPYATRDPAEAGFDVARLERGAAAAGELGLTNSLLVLHGGELVVERYWRGFDARMAHNVKSVSKSLLSALFGRALETTAPGALALDDPIFLHVPEPFYAFDDPRADITLHQLLTMSAGLDWDEGTTLGAMIATEDWAGFVLSQPLVEAPGTTFRYSTGNTHVGAVVLERALGEPLADWAHAELFEPLGITFTRWDVDPQGHAMGGAEVWMRPRDLARFGELYLRGGELDGQRVLSSDWVDATFTPESSGFFGGGYGLWWRRWVLDGAEAWAAVGYGGQLVVVVPARDLVVVATSEWSVGAATGDAQIGALYALLDAEIVAAAP